MLANKLRAKVIGSGQAVSITNRNISLFNLGSASVTYQLTSTGLARKSENGSYTTLETWLNTGLSSDYEVRATLSSGDALFSGTTGSWLNLATSREWEQAASSGDPFSSTLTVEIRMAASPFTVLDTATITLTAIS